MKRLSIAAVVCAAAVATLAAPAAAKPLTPAFSNTTLYGTWSPPSDITIAPIANSSGDSEPAIAFGADGAMAVDGLAWLPFQVNMWRGRFGATPSYFGAMDTNLSLQGKGRLELGDEDADTEITSAGTLLLADLDLIINGGFNNFQLGVSVTRCPVGVTSPAGCTTSQLDTAGADRPWITSYRNNVWVSYHDSQNSTMIRVKKSTDDGRTWSPSGSPLVAQGDVTGNSTFNSSAGPIVADPTTGYVYDGFMGGEQTTKCCSANYNNVYVSRSTDGGAHYTAVLVYHAPPFTRLNNFWPVVAVDSTTGRVWTAWTDQHGVWVSYSDDHAASWSMATKVSTITTTVMPWVAARDGKVDVVYYGSSASTPADTSAVWNVYDSQLKGSTWTVKQVSNTPNRVGAVCLEGSGCVNNTNRELLDLFEVAEDPISGQAAVIYTDSTLSTWTLNGTTKELPEIVLAFEN
jgi:hypothetical protein